MLNMTTTDVGVAGDWHGNKAWAKIALLTFHEYGIDTVIHVGDFGFWGDNAGQKYLYKMQKLCVQTGITLLVTLGNHEDYVFLSTFQPHPEMDGYTYHPDYPNILVADRGARWEWQGVSFVSLGGANSIDRFGRQEWVSWWAAEQISLGDVYRTVAGGHADIMVCHDAPAGVDILGSHRDADRGWSFEALEYAEQSRMSVRQAVDAVKPQLFFHGHYHKTVAVDAVLNDGNYDYDVQTICMNKDGSRSGNLGILSLPSKTFERIPVSYALIGEFYKNRPVEK